MDNHIKGNILPPAVAAISRSLKAVPDGFIHLARDGVLRSWDGQGKVVDYRQLSHEEVMLYLKAMDDDNTIKYEEWESVDGTKLTDAKALLNPEKRFRPRQLDLKDDKEEDGVVGGATQSET